MHMVVHMVTLTFPNDRMHLCHAQDGQVKAQVEGVQAPTLAKYIQTMS